MHPGDDPRRSRDADPHDSGDLVVAPVPVERPERSTRMRLAVVAGLASVVVVVGIIGPSAIGRPLIDLSGLLPRSPVPTPSATAGRITPPPATPLPRYEVLAEGGPEAAIPVIAGTYALLDPVTGAVRPLAADLGPGSFVGDRAGGTLCICVLESEGVAPLTVSIVAVSWDGRGTETERRLLAASTLEMGRTSLRLPLAPAVSRDRATAFVASARVEDETWVYRVEAFEVATGGLRWSIELDRLPVSEPSTSPEPVDPPSATGIDEFPPVGARVIHDIRISVAPSDDAVRVVATDAVHVGLGTFRIGVQGSWYVPLAAGGPGVPVPLGAEPGSGATVCEQGFATARDHVSICTTFAGAGDQGTTVRVGDPEGPLRHRTLLRDLGRDIGPALVDVDARLLYLWASTEHALAAIDLATGRSRLSSWHIDRDGRIDPPPADRAVTLGSTRTSWATIETSPGWWRDPTVVGSADGAHLYAVAQLLGPPAETGSIRRTGIFVIDARTLELIRVIPPAATHDSVSLTADGRFLLATGIPGRDERGRVSTWWGSLAIFDAQDGRLLARASGPETSAPIRVVWPPPSE